MTIIFKFGGNLIWRFWAKPPNPPNFLRAKISSLQVIGTDKFINIFTTHKFVKLKRLSFEMNLLALDNGKLSLIVLLLPFLLGMKLLRYRMTYWQMKMVQIINEVPF